MDFHVVVDSSNLAKIRHLIELYGKNLEVVRNPIEGNFSRDFITGCIR